jgi:DNA-binding winged helix-turn-helix (wHTH) protein
MSSLRRALGERKGYHPYIQTVIGRYYLITPVKELPALPETVTTRRVQGPAVRPVGEPEAKGEQSSGSVVSGGQTTRFLLALPTKSGRSVTSVIQN